MNFDKYVGRATVILPIIHLVTCGLYMAGYSAGFGGNIGAMFAASDFFTITIQHLITTYVLGLGMPLAVILIRHRSGRTYAADVIAREDDPVKRDSLIATSRWVVRFSTWALRALAVIPIVSLVCQIWTGAARDYYLALSLSFLALLPTWWNIANRLKLDGLPVELAWCGLAFVVGVLGLGMNSGDRDRRLPYKALSQSRMHCGKHTVLSPIGDRFISVTPDDKRHLIDDECKAQFEFVPTTIIPMVPLSDLISTKLNSTSSQKYTAPIAKTKTSAD